MVKKTITYKDYDGTQRTETFYFNLNRAELAKMQLSEKGGLAAKLTRITETNDVPALTKFFEELIERSYGVKSDDGRRFIKSRELYEEFEQTEAYSQLFMELAQDETKAAAFVNGVFSLIISDPTSPSEEKDGPVALTKSGAV